ncbi:hypothetical protein J6590_006733 [Homalodisca vitripennis]|nr:hypothetical protein J6590_006733 [Homalodisca vitripennis]
MICQTLASNKHEMARQIRTSPDHTTTQAQQLQTSDLCTELQANTGKQQPRACTVRHAPLPAPHRNTGATTTDQ